MTPISGKLFFSHRSQQRLRHGVTIPTTLACADALWHTAELGDSPLIIFTGDILGHNFPTTFFQLYYGNVDYPTPDDAAVTAMEAFADKTVAFFMGQVRLKIGNIPVMFAVGNADSY